MYHLKILVELSLYSIGSLAMIFFWFLPLFALHLYNVNLLLGVLISENEKFLLLYGCCLSPDALKTICLERAKKNIRQISKMMVK